MLGADASNPFFLFNDHKIYCLFDPPHLLKNLRRNLMKYDLQTNEGLVSFSHIEEFYTADQKLLVRCTPKLTDAHINATGLNSMKVSLAAQIFSHTVAAGMNTCIVSKILKAESAPTVGFILKINNLFDSLNGTSKNPLRGKEYYCAVKKGSVHQNFWKEILSFIQSWVFVHKQTVSACSGNKHLSTILASSGSKHLLTVSVSSGSKHLLTVSASSGSKHLPTDNQVQGKTRKQSPGPRSKTGWLMTVTAMLQLSEEMLVDWEYFMTKRCNQDCLEFFLVVLGRGGNLTNPSAYEFSSAFKLSAVNSFWSKSKFSNCEPDGDTFMHLLLTSASKTTGDEKQAEEIEKPEEEVESDIDNCLLIDFSDDGEDALENADILSQNTIAFLSGYLSRRVLNVLKIRECDLCQSQLVDKTKPVLQHTMFLHFKEYKDGNTEGGLVHPSVNMTSCIAAFLKTTETFLSANLSANNLISDLKIMLSESSYLNFIDCEIHASAVKEKILHFSLLLFLKIHLREKNREISRDKFDLKQLRTHNKRK